MKATERSVEQEKALKRDGTDGMPNFMQADVTPLDQLDSKTFYIREIIEAINADDLTPNFPDDELRVIARRVLDEYELDLNDQSHSEWRDKVEMARGLARMVVEAKDYPWEKASNLKYPMVALGAVQHNARLFPNLIKNRQVMKGVVNGKDPDGKKAARAQRLGEHRSYYLLEIMKGWVRSLDRSTIEDDIVGGSVKKIYFDPVRRMVRSDYIPIEDIIAPYDRECLDDCERVSHRMEMTRNDILEMVRAKAFRPINLTSSDAGTDRTMRDGDASADDQASSSLTESQHELIEQLRWEDFDGDGYKEPYIITVHKRLEEVLRIKACYDEETVYFLDGTRMTTIMEYLQDVTAQKIVDQALDEAGIQPMPETDVNLGLSDPLERKIEILRIEKSNYLIDSTFIPSMDGSWRGTGMGVMLAFMNRAVNDFINKIGDGLTLQNSLGGFKSKTARLPGNASEIMISPGEFIELDHDGDDIRKSVFPYQHPGPSPVTFNLLQMLIDSAKEVQSTPEIMTGKLPGANTPVGTTLAAIDQATQVFTSIFVRKHESLTREFRLINKLIRRYQPELNEYRGADGEWHQLEEGDSDFDRMMDVTPVADPQQVADAQAMIKADALIRTIDLCAAMGGNTATILRRYYEALKVPDIDEILPEDIQPPQDPGANVERQKLEIDARKLDLEAQKGATDYMVAMQQIRKIDAEMVEIEARARQLLAQAEAAEAGPQMDQYRQEIESMKQRHQADLQMYKQELDALWKRANGQQSEPGQTGPANIGGSPGMGAQPGGPMGNEGIEPPGAGEAPQPGTPAAGQPGQPGVYSSPSNME